MVELHKLCVSLMCIADGKSDTEYVHKFRYLSKCSDNVIMPHDLIEVYWGHHSIMDAQMACMTELSRSEVSSKYKWKYAINVCGTELPLRTNREIVQALKLLYQQGLSAIDLHYMDDKFKRGSATVCPEHYYRNME